MFRIHLLPPPPPSPLHRARALSVLRAMASSPAIGAREKKLVRISDFLLLHDDSDGAGGADHELLRRRRRRRRRQEDEEEEVVAAAAAQVASPPSPGTPRLRIPGFTCARLRFVSFRGGRGGRRDGGRKEELAAEKSEAASSSADEASGWCGRSCRGCVLGVLTGY